MRMLLLRNQAAYQRVCYANHDLHSGKEYADWGCARRLFGLVGDGGDYALLIRHIYAGPHTFLKRI